MAKRADVQANGFRWVPIDEVEQWDRNPRVNEIAVPEVARSILRFGFAAPAVVWASRGELRAGHTRIKAVRFLQQNRPVYDDSGAFLKWETRPGDDPFHVPAERTEDGLVPAPIANGVPVRWMEFASEEEATAYALADNKLGELADWDEEGLVEALQVLADEEIDLSGLGWDDGDLDALLDGGAGDPPNDKYTHKVEVPIYEPSMDEPPPVQALLDTSKSEALIAEVQDADLPGDVRDFLMAAAHRHTKFNYSNIAEFYAHATPEVQGLMERSALVIIDFEQALELGFVRMNERLQELAGIEQRAQEGR